MDDRVVQIVGDAFTIVDEHHDPLGLEERRLVVADDLLGSEPIGDVAPHRHHPLGAVEPDGAGAVRLLDRDLDTVTAHEDRLEADGPIGVRQELRDHRVVVLDRRGGVEVQRRHVEQLGPGVADHPLGAGVHVQQLQRRGVEDEDRVVAQVEGVEHPVEVVLGGDPLGDVADGGHHEAPCGRRERAQADFGVELGVVGASRPEQQAGTHRSHLGAGTEPGPVRPVRPAEIGRQQVVDRRPDEAVVAGSEHLPRLTVREHDLARFGGDHDAVRSEVEHRPRGRPADFTDIGSAGVHETSGRANVPPAGSLTHITR
ncbi:MAG: hypothetical protein V9G12_15480 [Microthrixaceae bacterium]